MSGDHNMHQKPRSYLDEKQLIQQCDTELKLAVIKTLLSIMQDEDNATRDRLKAAELLHNVSPMIFEKHHDPKG